MTDAAFIRPAEVDRLCADPSKARDELGWEPKIGFEELVAMMVDADMELLASSGGSAGEDFAHRVLVTQRAAPLRHLAGRRGQKCPPTALPIP